MDDIALPDFGRLIELLLKDCRTIQLLPYELFNSGHAMRLLPARDGKSIDIKRVNKGTLPTLDLEAAGLNWDRNADNVKADVADFLAKHTFTLWPTFSLPAVAAFAPLFNEVIEMQSIVMQMRHRHSWSYHPSESEMEQELLSPLQDISVGFQVSADPVITGLDLSNPVLGLITAVPLFVLPTWGKLDIETPIGKAFVESVRLIRVHNALSHVEDAYREYLDPKKRKWYMRFWNWRPRWEKVIAQYQQACKERLEAFNSAQAAAA